MATKKAATKKRATKKKTATKKPTIEATKKTRKQKTKIPPEQLAKMSRRDKIQAVIRVVNSESGGIVIRRASEAPTSYLLRRPTGIISLDIALGGGFPAAAPSVIVGPDGVGKDYVLWRTAAEVQRIYEEDFGLVAYFSEFRPDKPFMRDMCGLKVAMTDEELDELNTARANLGQDPLTKEERARYKEQVGEIAFIYGVTAEEGFDALIRCVESNAFQIAAVNSIGFLQTEAKESVETFKEFAQQRSEALLLSKFTPKLAMYLNRLDEANNANETSIIFIDQVRSKDTAPRPMKGRQPRERDKYRPGSGAWALKHGKALELSLHKGTKFVDESTYEVLGREISWEITKGKLGTHDGIKGSFNFFFDGGADIVGDLFNTCIALDILEQNGSWYSYQHEELGFRAQGKPGARRVLLEDEALRDHLREICFQKAEVLYRHK